MTRLRTVPPAEAERAQVGARETKPVDSRDYAIQTLAHLRRLWEDLSLDTERWQAELARAREARIWIPLKRLSLDDLLVAEIGVTESESVEQMKAHAAAAKANPLAMPGEIGNGRPSSPDNVRATYGNQSSYLARRIARDRPDILARMEAGEFKSVRAAAREAGIVRDVDMVDRTLRACSRFTDEQRERFIMGLAEMGWMR